MFTKFIQFEQNFDIIFPIVEKNAQYMFNICTRFVQDLEKNKMHSFATFCTNLSVLHNIQPNWSESCQGQALPRFSISLALRTGFQVFKWNHPTSDGGSRQLSQARPENNPGIAKWGFAVSVLYKGLLPLFMNGYPAASVVLTHIFYLVQHSPTTHHPCPTPQLVPQARPVSGHSHRTD